MTINTKGKKSYGHVVAHVYKSQQLWFIDSGSKKASSYYCAKLSAAELVITKDIQKHHQTCAPNAILLWPLFRCGSTSRTHQSAFFLSLDLATAHSVTRQYMLEYNVNAKWNKKKHHWITEENKAKMITQSIKQRYTNVLSGDFVSQLRVKFTRHIDELLNQWTKVGRQAETLTEETQRAQTTESREKSPHRRDGQNLLISPTDHLPLMHGGRWRARRADCLL